MCGRYYLEISKEDMSFVGNIDSFEYKTNYNISPQSTVPAIINNELINTKWGYLRELIQNEQTQEHYCLVYIKPI